MLIAEPKHESGPKELRVKIGVEYHLKLHALKLLRGKRIKQWTFYKRDEARIRTIKRMITRGI